MDELLKAIYANIEGHADLFYVMTFKLDILVGHSGHISAGAISTTVKILNLTVIVCHLGGPFLAVFPKKKNYDPFFQILLVLQY